MSARYRILTVSVLMVLKVRRVLRVPVPKVPGVLRVPVPRVLGVRTVLVRTVFARKMLLPGSALRWYVSAHPLHSQHLWHQAPLAPLHS